MIYKFKCIFELDEVESKSKNLRVWKKTSNEVNLKEFYK